MTLINEKQRGQVFELLSKDVDKLKRDIINRLEEDCMVQILPLFHLMTNLVLNFKFLDHREVFKQLAKTSHELRLMP